MRKVLSFSLSVFFILSLICCKEKNIKRLGSDNVSETELLKNISQIKLGMSESQVVAIVGAPKSSEKAPFSKTEFPIDTSCPQQSREHNSLLQSVKRDHYEWRFVVSKETTRLRYLDIYYDGLCKVSYLLDWSGMRWTLIEY